MRMSPLVLLALVIPAGGCSLLEAAQAKKPNPEQQQAIGDVFDQLVTIASVADDPASTGNHDLVEMVSFRQYARLVAPAPTKPRAAARARPVPLPSCISTAGNVHTFASCDIALDDGRQCVFDGAITRAPEGGGNRYTGAFTMSGASSCPTAHLGVDVFLEGPTDNPTLARGNLQFDMQDPAGESFTGSAVIDDIAITSRCTVPSAGEMTVSFDGVANGTSIDNQVLTVAFHDSPGCGFVTLE
jgi:hypothetical protein